MHYFLMMLLAVGIPGYYFLNELLIAFPQLIP